MGIKHCRLALDGIESERNRIWDGLVLGGMTMDDFMDKLAERITAQDMIRANTSAEVEELGRVKGQIDALKDTVQHVRETTDQAGAAAVQAESAARQTQEAAVRAESAARQTQEAAVQAESAARQTQAAAVQAESAARQTQEAVARIEDAMTSWQDGKPEQGAAGDVKAADEDLRGVSEAVNQTAEVMKDTAAEMRSMLAEFKSACDGNVKDTEEQADKPALDEDILFIIEEEVSQLGKNLAAWKEELQTNDGTLSKSGNAEKTEDVERQAVTSAVLAPENNEFTERLDDLCRELAGNGEKLASLQEAISGSDEKFAGLREAIAGNDEKFAGLREAIAGNDEKFAGLCEAIAGNDEKFAGLREIISGNSEKLDVLREMVQGLDGVRGEISDIQSLLLDMEDQLAKLQSLQEQAGEGQGSEQGAADQLQAQITAISEQVTMLRELTQESITTLRGNLQEESASLKAGMQEESASLKAGMQEEMASLKAGIQQNIESLRDRLQEAIASLQESTKHAADKAGSTEDSLREIKAELSGLDEHLTNVSNGSASKSAESAEEIKRFVKEQLDKLLEHNEKEGNSGEALEELKTLLEALKVGQDEKKKELEDKMTGVHEGLREGYHKECVKVYRNVQAAFTEENQRQTAQLEEKVGKLSGNSKMAMIFSILAFGMGLASVVLQILSVLKIL